MRTLEITTYIGCPFRCGYCPQDLLLATYKGAKMMSVDDFKMILENVPRDVQIDFSGFSEFLFHRDYLLFIEMARDYQTILYSKKWDGEKLNIDKIIKHNVSEIWSRAGSLFETEEKKGEIRCSITGDSFDHNVVLPNGDVYICCMDYGLKHKIGNLLTTHYDHLERDSLRGLMKKGNIICRYCELSEIVINE
jgi:radical SAM protein with 4Fe4S-binding SPASM domain